MIGNNYNSSLYYYNAVNLKHQTRVLNEYKMGFKWKTFLNNILKLRFSNDIVQFIIVDYIVFVHDWMSE